MKKAQVALAAIALLVVTLFASGSARADTYTYSYTSQHDYNVGFNSPGEHNNLCSPCSINIVFTVANELAPNSTYRWNSDGSGSTNLLDPLDISASPIGFGDASLIVDTDKSGNIDFWQFDSMITLMPVETGTCSGSMHSSGEDTAAGGDAGESISLSDCTGLNGVFEDGIDSESYQFMFVQAWTETTNVSTMMNAPEPSTLVLLSIGVLCAFLKMRRHADSCSR